MATKKKQVPPSKRTSGERSFGMTGLLDMNEISKLTLQDGMSDDDSEDEGNLEAELEAIISGKGSAPKKPKKQNQPVSIDMIQKMADDCMLSEDSDGADEGLSGDEDLMAELNNVIARSPPPSAEKHRQAPPIPQHAMPSSSLISSDRRQASNAPSANPAMNTLHDRLLNYKEAENVARGLGDTTKIRRYGRAVKTLETLIRECSNGREINEEDIPPPVVVNPKILPASEPAATPEPVVESLPDVEQDKAVTPPKPPMERQISSSRRISMKDVKNESTNTKLTTRRDQYKVAALNAKKSGDMAMALKYVKISKQFDVVIDALNTGQPIDLSKMPPPPPIEHLRPVTAPQQAQPKPAAAPPPAPIVAEPVQEKPAETPINFEEMIGDEKDAKDLFSAPAPPSTVLEALEQRLEKYISTQKAAVTENNTSKAKRLGRIIKQYQDAIKCHKLGKPVDYESLPAPPGFGAIPGTTEAAPAQPQKPTAEVKPLPRPGAPLNQPAKSPVPAKTAALSPQAVVKPAANRSPSSLLDKQLNFLTERHKLFREAALECKTRGDIEQAKEYLRSAKGIEPMIEATKGGLPIDATSIPTPPQLTSDFVILDQSDCLEEDWGGDKQEMFRTLERDLSKQIDICVKNQNHFLKLGDVSSSGRFQTLCMTTKQDLLVVQNMWKKGETLPKFHYETRVFSMVQCHSDLGDNEVEIKIVRGINLPGKPKELDSYVKIEFPFPTEAPQLARTHLVKDTNMPEFKFECKFEMNRKSRSLARVFKRHNMKLEVWSKGGFLRSDTHLGTAQVKLTDFETKCTIHDSFELMDGRKSCGGKIEVIANIRDPLLAKQVEEVKERWLIIGS